ncbi:MAG TPA: hypothetical protein VHK69_22500 [Chitinophagaceae bacterium]|nr:hypothetical protein [Chitinophagaceae bacterium]
MSRDVRAQIRSLLAAHPVNTAKAASGPINMKAVRESINLEQEEAKLMSSLMRALRGTEGADPASRNQRPNPGIDF